ncbi:MAG: PQQ-binding-like beta-propeller repeat protein [Proteobacteria bacterium]|nr:PQQ-binding-like beta-propeller repeat protein [Pseudomonadota bacterium]
MRAVHGWLTHFILAVLVVTLGGCGGGGGGSEPPPLPAPSGLSYTTPQNLRLNTAIAALSPTVTGTVSTYSVSPSLPAGLVLDSRTGVISGTPTQAAAATNYTITAANGSGSAQFSLSLSVFTLTVQQDSLTRFAADGASIRPTVTLLPVNLQVAQLYATAQDPSGLFLPGVDVAANTDGSFSLELTTNPSVSAAVFTGNVTINLCRDAKCATPLEVPSIAVPFNVTVLSPATAWPGNHLTAIGTRTDLPEWSMFQGNAAHTGFVPLTVNPDKVTTRWTAASDDVSGTNGSQKQNLTTANGLFYVVSSGYLDSGVVHAKRESDGTEVWSYNFNGLAYPNANPASVSGGVVYVPAGHQQDTYMFAFNAADGSVEYRAPMTSQWEGYLAPTIGPNGMLYANAGTYGGMYAFNPSGVQLFFSYEEQVSEWAAAVDSNAVYVYNGYLRMQDPLTGATLKDIADPTYQNYIYEVRGAPVLGAPGSVFVAQYANSVLNGGAIGNTLINFRTDSGTIGWKIAGCYPTTPAYRSGVLYVLNQTPFRLEARAEADGSLLWSWTPANPAETLFASEVLLTRNMAFVSTDRATYAIDLQTHLPAFSYPASGKLALSANAILYIQNPTSLIALNLD